jgi:hypothetical protein
MSRVALDTNNSHPFNIQVFDYSTSLNDSDEIYAAFESGWPVIIKNAKIPNLDYDYYDNLSEWVTPENKWVMPWYNSHIKNRDRLVNERGWNNDEITTFHQHHKQSQSGWNTFFDTLFPKYNTSERMLSHRYNTLVQNKLHLDELDSEHTGNEQQMRMFVQLDKKRPRVLAFGPTVADLYKTYFDEFNLYELDIYDAHSFITDIRDRCIWNSKQMDQFHLPLNYVTLDPGDIWFFNAQWISHQIVFGTKLQCFETDIYKDSLIDPSMCLGDRIKNL